MSTGFETLASAGIDLRAASRTVSSASGGSFEPGTLAGVRAEDAETAGVREHGDAVAARQRLRREENGRVEQLLERAQRAGRPPARRALRRRRRSSASAAVCELAARAPARLVPLRIARIGFERATRPGDPRELARVPERLEVEQDQVGRVVVLPVLEQVVRGDVGLVADRDEARQPEATTVRFLEQRQAERAALRREGDTTRREAHDARRSRSARTGSTRSRGSSGRSGVRRARARAPATRPGVLLRPQPVSAKPAEITQIASRRTSSASRAASSTRRLERRSRRGRPCSGGRRRRVAADAADRLAAAVDRIDSTREVGLRARSERARRRSCRGARTPRSRRPTGLEERAQRRGDADVVTHVAPSLEASMPPSDEPKRHLDDAILKRPRTSRSPRRRRRRASRVLRQDLGHELLECRPPTHGRRAARAAASRSPRPCRSSATANATSARAGSRRRT